MSTLQALETRHAINVGSQRLIEKSGGKSLTEKSLQVLLKRED